MYAIKMLANSAKLNAAIGLTPADAVRVAAESIIEAGEFAAGRDYRGVPDPEGARLTVKVAREVLNDEKSTARDLLVATVRHCQNYEHEFGECNH